MDRIVVEVFFPSLQRAFDIEIPLNMRFHFIADMIEQSVAGITGGQYIPSGTAILCDRIDGTMFDINYTPDQLCLHNGSRIMII